MNPEFEHESSSPSFQQNQDDLTPEQRLKKEQEQLEKDPLGIGHMFKDGQFMMPGYQKTTPDQSTDISQKQGIKKKEEPTIQPLAGKDVPKTEQNQPSTASSKDQTSLSPQGQLSTEQIPQDQKQDKTKKQGQKKQGQKDQPQKQEANVDKTSSKGYIDSVSTLQPLSFVEGIKQKSDIGNVLQREAQEFQKQNQQKHVVKDKTLGIEKQSKKILEEQQKDESRIPTEGQTIDPTVSDRETKQISVKHQEQNPLVPTELNPKAKLDKASQKDSGAEMMDELPQTDPGLNLSPGPTPQNWEDKQKNKEDLQDNQKEGNASVEKDFVKSLKAQQKDFGENEIYPKESAGQQTIKSTPLETLDTSSKLPDKTVEFSAEDAMKVNEGLKGQLQTKLNEQHDKLDAADEKRKTQHKQAELEHQQKVDQKNVEFTKKQETAQKDAQKQVAKERQNWKTESDKIRSEYKDSSVKERQKVDSNIQKKTEATDKQVKQEYKKAEQRAANEKKRREKEAADKKAKAKKDADKKGFWGRLTSAVKSFFDGLRKVLNFIFDQLRKAVKMIIEGVKKLVNGLIELARKAIVTMIKAFGEILKKLVSIALAAFPKLAAKINALIDKTVNAAVKVVNFLADSLKKTVSALLDLLGKALDAYLAAYQAIYNAVLDALEFVAVGLIEIMEGIANLVSAARRSPDFFWGQLSEELLGADITKPLPNEAPMPKSAQEASKIAVAQGKITQQDAQVLAKSKLEAKDAKVDPVVQNPILSPELQKIISSIPDGQEIEFGEQNQGDPNKNADLLKQQAAGMPVQQNTQQQGSTPSSTTTTQKTTQGKVKAQQPGQGTVGPFASPMERLSYLTGQMKEAVSKWWSKNKVTVIIGLVAGITGLILANIATGGAIMAALPLLLQIVGAFFTGLGILDMAKHFGRYLAKAFPGNIAGGAKSLARGLAALTIELIFALLFGAKGVIKGAKNAVKTVAKQGVKGAVKTGAKAVKNSAVRGIKNTAQAAKDLGGVAKDGFQTAVKNGKMVFQGAKRGVIQGAKTLDDVAKRLSKRFRFKRFKVQVKKRRFKLFGEFNPWVKLADGSIEEWDANNSAIKGKKAGEQFHYKDALGNQKVGSVLVPDVRKSQSWKEWAKTSKQDELIRIFKGKVPDDEILAALSKTQPTSLIKKWHKNKLIGKEELEKFNHLDVLRRSQKRGYENIENAFKKGDIDSSDKHLLRDILAREKRLSRAPKEITDNLKLSGWLDEVGLVYKNSVEKANFKNLWKKIEAEPNADMAKVNALLHYIKNNPQGIPNQLKNPSLSIDDIFQQIQKNTLGGIKKGSGNATLVTKLNNQQLAQAIHQLDPPSKQVIFMITRGNPITQLPDAQGKILRYLFESPKSGSDYIKMLSEIKATPADVNKIFRKIEDFATNKRYLKNRFRREVRNLVVKKTGNSRQGLDKLGSISEKMGHSSSKGELFDNWGKKFIPDQKGGRSAEVMIEKVMPNGKKVNALYKPDNIIEKSKHVEFTEFKQFTNKNTSLPAEDIAKIRDYAEAMRKGTQVVGKKPLKKVQYVFSDKATFDRFAEQILTTSDGRVVPRYVSFNDGKASLLP